jgi:hypothetical protein
MVLILMISHDETYDCVACSIIGIAKLLHIPPRVVALISEVHRALPGFPLIASSMSAISDWRLCARPSKLMVLRCVILPLPIDRLIT